MLARFAAKKCFSTSTVAWARRRRPTQTSRSGVVETDTNFLEIPDFSGMSTQELFDLEDMPEFEDQDTSGAGHRQLMLERQVLQYLRIIDGGMQQLQTFRQEYKQLQKSRPLLVRSISYGNEEHPATSKRTLVAPVSRLKLGSIYAEHKFILLAGPRWSATPPKDSGINTRLELDARGYIKISCELFPEPEMNLKWTIDVLEKLILSAKKADKKGESFKDIPLDFRHLESQRLKRKKGEHRSGLQGRKPTIRDFPREWLPSSNSVS